MPAKRISDLNSLGTADDADYIEVLDTSELLPDNKNKKYTLAALKNYVLTALTTPLHKNTHVTGGSDAFVVTDLLDAVARIGVRVANLLIGQRRHVNFIAGTNVTITALDDNINEKVDVTINSTVAGNVGDITGGLNVGTGEFIFKDKVVNDLRFKSIDGTGIATVTTNGDTIEVNVPANTGEANTGSNVGTGGRVFKIKNGVDFEHRTLVSTPSVTITENPDDLTFVANDLTTISHTGGGLQIAAKTLLNTQYNTLQAGTNMSIVPTLGAYVFNTSAQPNAGINLGAGHQVFKQVNAGIPEYRTLTNGTGITLSSSGTEVNVVNSLPMVSGNFIFTSTGSTVIQGVNDLASISGSYLLVNPEYTVSAIGGIFINTSVHINGNYNKINILLNSAIEFSTGSTVYIENVNFNLFNPTTFGLKFTGQKVIIRNCTFTKAAVIGGFFIRFVDCDFLIENCSFYSTGTGQVNQYIEISGSNPQNIIFKNNVFYKDSAVTSIQSINALTVRNVTFLGNNYSDVATSGVTPVVGTLTIVPTLNYLT